MKYLKAIGLIALASLTSLGTGCASKTTGSAMVLTRPSLVDTSVASSLNGRDGEALIALLLASGNEIEDPIDAASALLDFAEPRLSTWSGESGIDRLVDVNATITNLVARIANDSVIENSLRVEYIARLETLKRSIQSRVDRLANDAIDEATRTADTGDNWIWNDRAKIHDALVFVAPFSRHPELLTPGTQARLAKTRAYILSYVEEAEHRQLLIDSGHVAN
jgi:hypothetical protein